MWQKLNPMAELFASFNVFKTYVGGRINTSIELASLEPTIYETARRHITPWLGESFYDYLVAGSNLTAAETALLPYVRRPLAILTMYEWAKVASVEVGESGMHRIESADRKSAYRYQERAYKDDALEKGYNALETMLKYLHANQDDLTDWRDSDEGQLHLSTLLNYASDFRLLAMAECDRYTYECIRTMIAQVQEYAVEKLLPASYWEAFQGRYVAGTLTTQEKNVLKKMRKAIAHRAIEEAIAQKWIRIEGGRVAVHEDFGDQRNTNVTMPTTTGAGLPNTHIVWGDRYTSDWVNHIKANQSDFEGVFDEESGGSNTDSDAWHIDSETEAVENASALVEFKNSPIYRF